MNSDHKLQGTSKLVDKHTGKQTDLQQYVPHVQSRV